MAEYISREKIAAEARELSTHPLNEWDTMGVLALIDRQPAADVQEVRHGHWVWHDDDNEYECSACHIRFDYDKTYALFDNGYPLVAYCPHCGAKMDESEDEEPVAKDINVPDRNESEDEGSV